MVETAIILGKCLRLHHRSRGFQIFPRSTSEPRIPPFQALRFALEVGLVKVTSPLLKSCRRSWENVFYPCGHSLRKEAKQNSLAIIWEKLTENLSSKSLQRIIWYVLHSSFQSSYDCTANLQRLYFMRLMFQWWLLLNIEFQFLPRIDNFTSMFSGLCLSSTSLLILKHYDIQLYWYFIYNAGIVPSNSKMSRHENHALKSRISHSLVSYFGLDLHNIKP